MTVEPATLAQMLASTRFEVLHAAIVARLGALLKGVTVIPHPGKLDINDVIAKAVVAAPGVAVGWNRMRAIRDLGGTFALPVDFVAYLVVEDWADGSGPKPRRVDRAAVASAIGAQILRILADETTGSWGLGGITPPWPDPEPAIVPVFTMKSAQSGTSLFGVTWSQAILLEGRSDFDGPRPRVEPYPAEGPPEGMEFDVADGDLPPEIRALATREEFP